jgi:hypothetical protein
LTFRPATLFLFPISAFQLFSFSAFQLFSFSAFQLFSFSAFQLFSFSAFQSPPLWFHGIFASTIAMPHQSVMPANTKPAPTNALNP